MTEHNSFAILNKTCRGCLTSSDNLFQLSPCEMKVYTNFVNKSIDTDFTGYLCLFCKWMLLKLTKFSEQCQKADIIINELAPGMDSILPNISAEHKYGMSKIELHYIGPDEYDMEVKDDEVGVDDDDDDDVPLVMFCDEKLSSPIKEPDIKVEIEMESIKKKKKERKNIIKDGFTSRMVQETEEYVVIKLNKEQVLQEMLERSKTEFYLRAPYKCEKCVKGFNFEDVLESHNEKHSLGRGSYFCEICTQYCPNQVSLRGHIKSHTTRYKCKLCGVIRLSRQHLLEHHAITHTTAATDYSCDTCEFTTNKRTVIQRHVKSHATTERHACDKCGKLFNTRDKLRVHTMRHDKSKRVQCSQCDNNFIYPSLLHKHIQSVHERKDYYCVECDVSFKSPESLRLHFKKAKRHRDSSSYKYSCSQCSQVFVSASSRAAHMSAVHDMPKRHICQICHKYYSSTDALRAHTWRVHTHKERVCCEYCDKIFSRKSILKVHLRSHDITAAHAQGDIQIQKPENLPNTIKIPQNMHREP